MIGTFLAGLLVFSCIGFAGEALFTGIGDIVVRVRGSLPFDRSLPCSGSLWTVPVYGLSAAVTYPLGSALLPQFFAQPWPLRGAAYVLGIFAWEYAWGWFLERTVGLCPWRYKPDPRPWRRYINPAFAPLWFSFGFVLEWTHLKLTPVLLTLF